MECARRRIPERHVFQTYEWFECWWSAFGQDRELFLVTVWDGDALAGIAPLMTFRRAGLAPARVCRNSRMPTTRTSSSGERAAELLPLLARYLFEQSRRVGHDGASQCTDGVAHIRGCCQSSCVRSASARPISSGSPVRPSRLPRVPPRSGNGSIATAFGDASSGSQRHGELDLHTMLHHRAGGALPATVLRAVHRATPGYGRRRGHSFGPKSARSMPRWPNRCSPPVGCTSRFSSAPGGRSRFISASSSAIDCTGTSPASIPTLARQSPGNVLLSYLIRDALERGPRGTRLHGRRRAIQGPLHQHTTHQRQSADLQSAMALLGIHEPDPGKSHIGSMGPKTAP